ncbi:MAG TPA: 2-succinyl-5-enolpyruvyl-6-hydroxy-3-cyclohexene-1-carboxylic-acid synthase [Nocardioidaceae bacterium]|nr:2-succinyl-5-enolpyruvyl-6-hydroxy-3-cyclohexene-1-carboxylic-acid synthase [Nocardioidaceae bacterium]
MTPANASTALAATLVDELHRHGVTDLVLAPGSRSAPLAFAAAESRLRLHTRIDERSAGFLALGLAKTSRRPVAVVTTSGTAAANLHPAVLEASHAGVPLLVLTADRPARLRGTGANQTTDQVRLYGAAVRLFADVPAGHPGADEGRQVVGWRSLTSRAYAAATGSPPGPVHLNVQLEEPLVPDAADGWASELGGRPQQAPWTRAEPRGPRRQSLRLDPSSRRTVVVAGDDAGPPARVLAEEAALPLLAEPSSGSRTGENAIRTYRLLLGDPSLADRIEQVVVFGHPTLSRPVSRLLSRGDVEVVAVPGRVGWTDPGHAVGRVADGVEVSGPGPADWLVEWKARDEEVGKRLDALLDGWAPLAPQHVAAEVAASLPAHGLLFVGSSNPVRDLDLMVPRYPVGEHRMVIANRGLAGIDGSVSTAVGAAVGRDSARSLALLGDVTFLHDTNGLLLGPDEVRPDLTIVVVNDDGGSIFALLEQGAPSYSHRFETLFGTPHHADLAALCRASGTPHRRVHDRDALRAALAEPAGGIEVVEAVVRRDDRRDLDAAVRALATP